MYLWQGLIIFAVVGTNTHWTWTLNAYENGPARI
jgi:hypothetical protein